MNHDHIDIVRAFELASEPERGHTPEAVECERCASRCRAARTLLESMRTSYDRPTGARADDILARALSDEELLASFSRRRKKTPRLSLIIGSASAGAAACLLIAFNFLYGSFLYRADRIALAEPLAGKVSVTRPGLWFGSAVLTAKDLIPGKDRITAREDLLLPPDRGLGIAPSAGAVFSYTRTGGVPGAAIVSGRFTLDFKKGTEREWRITLPADEGTVVVTGTRILVDAESSKTTLLVLTGKAVLRRNGIVSNLDNGGLYVSDSAGLRQVPFRTEDEKSSWIASFPSNRETLDAFYHTEIEPRPAVKGPRTTVITIDGKSFTGLFRAMGDKILVTTENGETVIPASSVKKIFPARQ